MKNYPYPRAWPIFALAALALTAQTGCMTVQQGSAVVEKAYLQNLQTAPFKKMFALM